MVVKKEEVALNQTVNSFFVRRRLTHCGRIVGVRNNLLNWLIIISQWKVGKTDANGACHTTKKSHVYG